MPTKVTDEDRFDFQSWVTGVRPAIRQVTIYSRPDLVRKVNELRHEQSHDDKPRTYKAADSSELRRLTAEMESHAMTVVIKGNSDVDVKAARASAKATGDDPDDDDQLSPHHLAQNIVHVYNGPQRDYDFDGTHTTLTASQIKSLRTAIGEAQYTKLWLAMIAVSNDAPEPTPDFSQPSSPDRGTTGR